MDRVVVHVVDPRVRRPKGGFSILRKIVDLKLRFRFVYFDMCVISKHGAPTFPQGNRHRLTVGVYSNPTGSGSGLSPEFGAAGLFENEK